MGLRSARGAEPQAYASGIVTRMGGNRSAGSVAPAIERGPTGTQRSLTTDDHEREGLSRNSFARAGPGGSMLRPVGARLRPAPTPICSGS